MTAFIGEIRMFAGNFPPNGWLFCDGSLLSIGDGDNEILFQLIGTTYGGDGENTFQLPNLQGRAPVHMGQAPDQTYVLGEQFGVESVTLTTQQMPNHTHPLLVSTALGTSANPEGNVLSQPSDIRMYIRDTPGVALPARTVLPQGGSQPHDNMAPFLAVNFIISLYGIFPSPS